MDILHRDATAVYFNSLIGIFDDVKSPNRKLKRELLADYLIERWLVTDKENPEAKSLFWSSFGDKYEGSGVGPFNIDTGYETDAEDVMIYLLTDKAPKNQSWLRENAFPPLTPSEKIDIILVIEDVIVNNWSVETCRINHGLAGMLKVLSAIVNNPFNDDPGYFIWPDKSISVIDDAMKNSMTTMIAKIIECEPDINDFTTMFGVANIFSHFQYSFFLKLPAKTTDYNDVLRLLADSAFYLMTEFADGQENPIRLFDGELLPLAMVSQALAKDDVGIVIELATARFGVNVPDDLRLIEATVDGETRKGCYHLESAIASGNRLLQHFGLTPYKPSADTSAVTSFGTSASAKLH